MQVFYSGVPPVSTRGGVRDTRIGRGGVRLTGGSGRVFSDPIGSSEAGLALQRDQDLGNGSRPLSPPPLPITDVSGPLGGGEALGKAVPFTFC